MRAAALLAATALATLALPAAAGAKEITALDVSSEPAARGAEVVPAPAPDAAGGEPTLMWTGGAGVVLLLAAGAWRARRR